MKTVGIVAEFNPFHDGHEYLIKKAKELTGASCAIIAMSGDFVQRGECAVFDKYIRAKSALFKGADLILMLPVNISTASSETFAAGAVNMLAKAGVDYLAFGCENVNDNTLDDLSKLATFLCDEPQSYKDDLLKELKLGVSYPKARRNALANVFDASVLEYLDNPNSLLAIEYLKAINKYKHNITPLAIERIGKGHHATASMLREDIKKSCNISDTQALFCDDCSALLNMRLHDLTRNKELLMNYDYIDEAFANKICNVFKGQITFSKLCMDLKSKDLTYSHISRALLRILLDVKGEDTACHYIRILGMTNYGREHLSKFKKTTDTPIITKLAYAKGMIEDPWLKYFEYDCHASSIYKEMLFNKYNIQSKSDYEISPILNF